MIDRYTLINSSFISSSFEIDIDNIKPNYNANPTQKLPIITFGENKKPSPSPIESEDSDEFVSMTSNNSDLDENNEVQEILSYGKENSKGSFARFLVCCIISQP